MSFHNIIFYANGMLVLIGLRVLYTAWHPSQAAGAGVTAAASSKGFVGLETAAHFGIFFTYVTFNCTHTFLQHRASSSGYSVISATVLIYFVKMVVAFFMFLARGDGSFAPLFQPAIPDHPHLGNTPAFILLLVPGVTFAVYDVLSYMALAEVDPVTYVVIRSLRIVGIVAAWQPTLGIKLTDPQLFALFVFIAASVTKGIDQLDSFGFASSKKGMLILAGHVGISIIASIASELLLKKLKLHTDLLLTCQYFESLIILIVLLSVCGPEGALAQDLLGMSSWQTLYNSPWMISSILCLSAFGILTAYFLRDLSNILKELSSSFVILVTAVIEWGVLKSSQCTALGTQAVCLSILAIVVYNADPISTKLPEKTLASQ